MEPTRHAGKLLLLFAWLAQVIPILGVELLEGPVVAPGTNSAVLRWRTDVAAGARVRFGVSLKELNDKAQGPVGTNHAVVLEKLRAGSRYHFTIGTARQVLATNSFITLTAAGVPHEGTIHSGSGDDPSPPPPPPAPPPASETWGSLRSLQDHFNRHGRDFRARNPEDYAAQAWQFLQQGKTQGYPAKRDVDGVLRVYDPKTRAFGAYNRDGTTRTFFKPSRRDYFADQPGEPVNLKEER